MRGRLPWFTLGAALTALFLALVYQLPPVQYQLGWRFDAAASIVVGWLHPGDTLPTPLRVSGPPSTLTPLAMSTITPTAQRSPTPTLTPTPLPEAVALPSPEWEKQDWNNCGPATLSLALRFYGWPGDQRDISSLLKPDRGDRNVNVEELVYYVRTRAGWLNADYRVGGTLEALRRFLATGWPVVIEKGYIIQEGGGGWAGHYLLLTGYDDARQAFLAQDTNIGPDQWVPYDVLDEGWQAFNRVFIYLYPPEQQADMDRLLGLDADPDVNRQRALEAARAEIEDDPQDPYAWFNLGTNLLYFERYGEAAQAFDAALSIGLPWRFTRYQFGPYIAYFHQGRFQDVIDLANATLARTSKAEESLLWRGWARFRLGDRDGALDDFQAALAINPNYLDAQYAIHFITSGS
ncbi:MAG: tetratricopeptide repeat protein [Chloroflexota bacterium]